MTNACVIIALAQDSNRNSWNHSAGQCSSPVSCADSIENTMAHFRWLIIRLDSVRKMIQYVKPVRESRETISKNVATRKKNRKPCDFMSTFLCDDCARSVHSVRFYFYSWPSYNRETRLHLSMAKANRVCSMSEDQMTAKALSTSFRNAKITLPRALNHTIPKRNTNNQIHRTLSW